MALVSTLLGGGMSSRLFQRVREELGLAYSVYTFQSFHHDAGIHGVYVGTGPDTAALATEAIVEELARIAAEGIPDDELAAGKNQLKGQITLSLESVSSRMYRAAGVELYDEEFRSLDEVLALIDSIDRESVLAVCRDFFAPEVQTIVSLGPGASARASLHQQQNNTV
jgi:predicted Zn-dependent peptidase